MTAETKVEVGSAAGAWSYLQSVTQVEGKADAAAEGEMCPEIEAETVHGEKTQIEGVTEIESEAETETRAEIVEPETETGGRSEVRGNEAGSDTKASNVEGELLAVQSDRDLLATTAAAAAGAAAGAAQRTLLARSSAAKVTSIRIRRHPSSSSPPLKSPKARPQHLQAGKQLKVRDIFQLFYSRLMLFLFELAASLSFREKVTLALMEIT